MTLFWLLIPAAFIFAVGFVAGWIARAMDDDCACEDQLEAERAEQDL